MMTIILIEITSTLMLFGLTNTVDDCRCPDIVASSAASAADVADSLELVCVLQSSQGS